MPLTPINKGCSFSVRLIHCRNIGSAACPTAVTPANDRTWKDSNGRAVALRAVTLVRPVEFPSRRDHHTTGLHRQPTDVPLASHSLQTIFTFERQKTKSVFAW